MGLYWGAYLSFNPKALTGSLETLIQWHAEGKIKPHVSQVFPLEQAADGLEMLRSRKSTGKVIIQIQDL
jgi:NADPH2:quinone reductase